MRHLKKYNESKNNVFINYDIFNKNYQYRYDLSQTILKKVEDEVRDEILEFFYSIIDDLTPESGLRPHNPNDVQFFGGEKKINKNANTWSYRIMNNFQNQHSSSNCLSKSLRDFTVNVGIDLSKFDPVTTMEQIKSIYDNMVESGYQCRYTYINTVVESNIPQHGYKGEDTKSLELSFAIKIKGDDVLPRIGIDVNKLTG